MINGYGQDHDFQGALVHERHCCPRLAPPAEIIRLTGLHGEYISGHLRVSLSVGTSSLWVSPIASVSVRTIIRHQLLGTYLGKTAPENTPVSLNSLFPEDSVSTDSDEDLAEELDEFFRFMIWNDLSGEEEEKDSSSIEDEELQGSVSATDLFAEIDDFDE